MPLDFILEHWPVLLFYLVVFSLAFYYRKHKSVTIQGNIIVLWRTKFGISAMDKIARKMREFMKLLGYIGIGVGFLSMAAMVGFIFFGLYNLFFKPDAPPVIAPIIPGVQVPGIPFATPFVETVLVIFIVAIVHEFAHGVIARAHRIRVKSSGPALFGPFLAAFVEPDEKELKKQPDTVNYSIFAAGTFSNLLLAALLVPVIMLSGAVSTSLYPAAGLSFGEVQENFPAQDAGIQPDTIYTSINDKELNSYADLRAELALTRPGDTITLGTSSASSTITLGEHPDGSGRGYMGVVGLENHFENEESTGFSIFNWWNFFVMYLAIISVGIGTANMIPVGPIDGGRMFLLAATRIFGERKGQKVWLYFSLILFVIVLVQLLKVLLTIVQGAFSG